MQDNARLGVLHQELLVCFFFTQVRLAKLRYDKVWLETKLLVGLYNLKFYWFRPAKSGSEKVCNLGWVKVDLKNLGSVSGFGADI